MCLALPFYAFISAKITFFPFPVAFCLFVMCSFKLKIKIDYWAYQTLFIPTKMEYIFGSCLSQKALS